MASQPEPLPSVDLRFLPHMASQPEPLPSVDLRFSPHMASQPEPLPSVDLNPNDAESDEEIDGVYAISPLCHKIAIGLRRYRLFVIKLQQVCGEIAFLS